MTKTTKQQTNAERMAGLVDKLTELATTTGTLPWAKPWTDTSQSTPRSGVTGKAYRGVNRWWLGALGEAMFPGTPNVWVTYRQAQAEGGQVRKGESSTIAVLWKFLERVDPDTGETKTIPMLRTFPVFHWTQCDWTDGEPKVVTKVRAAAVRNEDLDPHGDADRTIKGYLAAGGPSFAEGGDRAFYSPQTDHVQVPELHQFSTIDGRYRTVFHELGHSTGASHRLDRDLVTGFGTERYSREELVAEMTAAMCCDRVGLDSLDGHTQSAAYLQSWLKALKDDPMALSWAATRAERATALIFGDTDEEVQA
jgi:antirestriction protein ArdC